MLCGLASGIFTGTSFIPFPGWALLFCYAPLWLYCIEVTQSYFQSATTLNNPSPNNPSPSFSIYKKVFISGWIAQFTLTLIGFNWIYYVSSEFGQLPGIVSAAALLLFASLMHIYIPISLVIATRLLIYFKIKEVHFQLLIYALSLALIERIWPSIFEWNLAYAFLWIKWPIYQWADTVGFWGLSTWLLIFQAFISLGLYYLPSNKKKSVEILAITFVIFLALNGIGTYKYKYWTKFDQKIEFGVVQANVGNAEKTQSEQGENYHGYIFELYKKLTDKNLSENPKTEIMLWPETAIPFPLDNPLLNRIHQSRLINQINEWKIPLITGGYSVDFQQKDQLGQYIISNSVFFLQPSLNNQSAHSNTPYNKTDLLVFGEYMPFGEYFPILYKLLPFVGTFKKGPGPTIKNIALINKNLKIGPEICYESLNPAFSRGLANYGAQIIFNVTNDSWFGWWAEPFQHQYMTLARAIEVRRPLVRSTNTGFTSVILANGDLLENSPINKEWYHTYSIPYSEKPQQSLYTKIGFLDWTIWLIILICIIILNKKKETHA